MSPISSGRHLTCESDARVKPCSRVRRPPLRDIRPRPHRQDHHLPRRHGTAPRPGRGRRHGRRAVPPQRGAGGGPARRHHPARPVRAHGRRRARGGPVQRRSWSATARWSTSSPTPTCWTPDGDTTDPADARDAPGHGRVRRALPRDVRRHLPAVLDASRRSTTTRSAHRCVTGRTSSPPTSNAASRRTPTGSSASPTRPPPSTLSSTGSSATWIHVTRVPHSHVLQGVGSADNPCYMLVEPQPTRTMCGCPHPPDVLSSAPASPPSPALTACDAGAPAADPTPLAHAARRPADATTPTGPTIPDFDPSDWASVRAQFPLDPAMAQFAAFVLSPHTAQVDAAIDYHRQRLAFDTEGTLLGGIELEDAVRQAAADYAGGAPGAVRAHRLDHDGHRADVRRPLAAAGRRGADDHVTTSTRPRTPCGSSSNAPAPRSGESRSTTTRGRPRSTR